MTSTFRLDIPVNESPVPAALDCLYDFVRDAGNAGAFDQVAVLGSIIEYDITKTSRLYNDYVTRAFSDRTVRTSPLPSLGLGDTAERYSAGYIDMLRFIVAGLDTDLKKEDQDKIEQHSTAVDGINGERRTWLKQLGKDWADELKTNGIDPSKIDADENVRQRYYDLRVRFLKNNDYASVYQEYENRLDDRRMKIEAIRLNSYPDNEARKLVLLYKQATKFKTIRPRRPELEIKHQWDEFTIQNPENASMDDIFDIGPIVESIVDPRTVLVGGDNVGQGYSVKSETKVTDNHDSAWGVSGGASWIPFVRGEFKGQGESHFKSTIEKIREIGVHFDHVARLDIARGGWFSKEVFGFARVKEFLQNNKVLAQNMSLLTTSLIIGRGLSLTLNFKDKSDVHEWGSTSRSGGGGVSICGYRIGGDAGGSSSWESRTINEVNQTVTFKDDPSTCRILGVIVSPVNELSVQEIVIGTRPLYSISEAGDAAKSIAGSGGVVDFDQILNLIVKP